MKLSCNFALSEFLVSETAARHGITLAPSDEHVENLSMLCKHVLQPLRDALGAPLHVSSGFRSVWLNQAVGGEWDSQHLTGQAADVYADNVTPYDLAMLAYDEGLLFDQLIVTRRILHVSYSMDYARGEILTKVDGRYIRGAHRL